MSNPGICVSCGQYGVTPWNLLMTARTCSYCKHVEEREAAVRPTADLTAQEMKGPDQ